MTCFHVPLMNFSDVVPAPVVWLRVGLHTTLVLENYWAPNSSRSKIFNKYAVSITFERPDQADQCAWSFKSTKGRHFASQPYIAQIVDRVPNLRTQTSLLIAGRWHSYNGLELHRRELILEEVMMASPKAEIEALKKLVRSMEMYNTLVAASRVADSSAHLCDR